MKKFYSTKSEKQLKSCHPDLQLIFNEVLPYFDHSIIVGHRSEEGQKTAFANKASQLKWPLSKHNKIPSKAVDVIPYPIDWSDTKRIAYFAGFVKGISIKLKQENKISHGLRWGGDWDNDTQVKDNRFNDLCHYELI